MATSTSDATWTTMNRSTRPSTNTVAPPISIPSSASISAPPPDGTATHVPDVSRPMKLRRAAHVHARAGGIRYRLSTAALRDQAVGKEASAMNGIGIIVLGVRLAVIASAWLWRRYRRGRWPLVSRSVRCPLHDCRAEVTVRIDPDAAPLRGHADVVACSLVSGAAVALPARTAYLPDSPPCRVVLEPA